VNGQAPPAHQRLHPDGREGIAEARPPPPADAAELSGACAG
jgi:hypothetical protein